MSCCSQRYARPGPQPRCSSQQRQLQQRLVRQQHQGKRHPTELTGKQSLPALATDLAGICLLAAGPHEQAALMQWGTALAWRRKAASCKQSGGWAPMKSAWWGGSLRQQVNYDGSALQHGSLTALVVGDDCNTLNTTAVHINAVGKSCISWLLPSSCSSFPSPSTSSAGRRQSAHVMSSASPSPSCAAMAPADAKDGAASS